MYEAAKSKFVFADGFRAMRNSSSFFRVKFLISLQGSCHVDRVGRTFDLVIFGPAVNIEQQAGAAPCLDLVGGTAGLHLPCAGTVPKARAEPRGSCSAAGIAAQSPALLVGMFLGGKSTHG